MALLIFLWLRFTFTILFLRLRSFAISYGHSILKKLFLTFVKFYKVKISSIFLLLFNILKRLPYARNSKTLLTVSQKLALSPLKWAIDAQRMILPLIPARENVVLCYVAKDSESFESDSEEDSDEDNPQESADGCSETPSVVEENSGKEESPKCPRGVTSRKGFSLQSPSHSAGAASLQSPSQQATQFPEKSPSAAQATERNDGTKLAPVETRKINIGSRRNRTKQQAASNVQETLMKRNKQPDLGISEVKSFKKGGLPEFILEVESSSKKTMKEGDAVLLRTPSHQSTGVPFQSPSHQAMGVPFQSPSRPAAPFSVQSAGHPAAPVSVQSPSRRAAPFSVQFPRIPIAAVFVQSPSRRLMDYVYGSVRLDQPFHKRDTPKMMRSIEADKGEQSAGPQSPWKRRIGPGASFSGKKQRFEQESESDRANTELKEADDHSLCRYETLGPSRSSPEKLPSVAKATGRMSRTKSVTAETRTINIGSSRCQTEQQAASNVQETFIRRNRQPDQSASEVKSFKKSDLPKFILEVESLSKTMKDGDAASVLHPNAGSDTPPEQEKSDESNFHKRDTPKMMRSIEADKGEQSAAGGSNASADASSVRLGKRAENARTPGITGDNIEQPAHKIHKRVKESHQPVSQQASNLVRSEENVFIESSAETSGDFRSDSASLRPDPETHIDILEGLASRLIDQHRYESEEDSAKGLSSRMANKDESISTNPEMNKDGTRKPTISEAASEEVRNISSKRPSVIITVETPILSEAASKEVHNISSIRPSVIIPVEALDCVGVSGQSSSSVSTRRKGSSSPRERPQRLRPDPGSTLRKEEKDMQFALLESWNEEKSRAETPGQEKSGISEKKGRVALEGEHGSKGKEAEPHKEAITESAAFGAGPSYADPKKVKKDHRYQKKFYREKRKQLEADNKKPKQDPFGDVDDHKLKEKGKEILNQGEIIREELHLHTDSDKNISPTDSYRNSPLKGNPSTNSPSTLTEDIPPSLRMSASPSDDRIHGAHAPPEHSSKHFPESPELHSSIEKTCTGKTALSDPKLDYSPSVDASTSSLLRDPAHDAPILTGILSRPPLIDSTPVSLPLKSFHGREYPPEVSGPSGDLLGYQPEVSDQSDELRGCPPEVSVPSDDLSECPPEVSGPSGEPRVHPPEDPSVPSVDASTSSLLRDPAHDAPILSGILSRPSLIDSTPVSSPQKSVHGREYQPEVSDQSELRGCPTEVSVPSGEISEYSPEVPGPSGERSVHPPEDPSLPGELSEPVLVDPDLSDLEAHLSQLNLYGRPPSVHLNPPAQIIRPIALRINQYNAPLYFPSTFSIPFSSPSVRLNPLPLVILPAAPWTPYEGPLILEGSLRFPNLAVWLQSLSSGVVRPYSLQEGSSRGLEHSSHASLAGGATLTASPNELAAANPEITSLFLMPSPENQLSNNGSANELSEMPEANIRDTGTGGSDKSHKNGADDGDETKVKSGTETKHSSPGEITNEAGGSETARSSLTMKRVKNWKKEMGENYSKSLMIGSSSISTEPLSSGAELSAQNNEHRLTEENLVSDLSSILPSSHSSSSRSESTNVAELRPPSDSGASVSAPGKISPMHGEGEARELLPHSSSKLPSSHFPPLTTEEAKVTELLQTSDSGGAVPSSGSITAEDSEATESLSDYGESGGYVISNPISSSSEHENGETERAPVPGSGDIPAKPQSPNNERTSK